MFFGNRAEVVEKLDTGRLNGIFGRVPMMPFGDRQCPCGSPMRIYVDETSVRYLTFDRDRRT